VRRIFARISPNLPEKSLCDFCIQIFTHKDHETLFWCGLQKRSSFVFLLTVARHFCPDFQGFCQDFRKIKPFGGTLAPPPPTPLTSGVVKGSMHTEKPNGCHFFAQRQLRPLNYASVFAKSYAKTFSFEKSHIFHSEVCKD